jgi:hypothetical protein
MEICPSLERTCGGGENDFLNFRVYLGMALSKFYYGKISH